MLLIELRTGYRKYNLYINNKMLIATDNLKDAKKALKDAGHGDRKIDFRKKRTIYGF